MALRKIFSRWMEVEMGEGTLRLLSSMHSWHYFSWDTMAMCLLLCTQSREIAIRRVCGDISYVGDTGGGF